MAFTARGKNSLTVARFRSKVQPRVGILTVSDRSIAGVYKDKSGPVIRQLVTENTMGRFGGILGEPRVNVLALNMALDAASR